PAPVFAEADAVEAGLYRRLDMANAADAVIDAQRKVHVAADGLRAELNLVGTGSVRSNRSNTDSVAAGATVDLPLDRVAEQTVYRKALLTLEQRRRDYDLAADTVRLEVREAYRKLMEAAQRYIVAFEGARLARTRLDKTVALMEYGRASSRRVLDAQGDLYAANDAITSTLTDYAIATLEFYRDTGILQVRPDGMYETGPAGVSMARGATIQ
ncbi:MAG: TolC family protein, partial [Phycisphaerae bacterium]|nr:TolC family protein [Phycisphaerae bacterium]